MFDDLTIVSALRNISLFVEAVGILAGLDLIIGAPITTSLNNLLNKVINFEKSLDKPAIRVGLGITFVVISGLMMSFVMLTK